MTDARRTRHFESDGGSSARTAQRLIRHGLVALGLLAGLLVVPAASQEFTANVPIRPPVLETRDGSHDAIPRLIPASMLAVSATSQGFPANVPIRPRVLETRDGIHDAFRHNAFAGSKKKRLAMVFAGLAMAGAGSYLAATAKTGDLVSTVSCVPDLRGNCLPSLRVRRVEPEHGRFFGGIALAGGGVALSLGALFGK